ncbi:hypothetical protein GLAREA_10912 [Glarea lozoyensis ATCC 20868]|uniref:Uncharacterized protein n=1 Tax=Glarea lozoyensis (strain ATCC 20868 / MF5171) TaxID=1116229 RepID=S3DBW6_GLAL2|nr:uncharacterized protein GLAREA_10912 [Glarea lozoyensis ATCC 20868]EPE35215.1 hypothetical protein GLAREA_10912 [Glarea lozoyensis ATCC 20868]
MRSIFYLLALTATSLAGDPQKILKQPLRQIAEYYHLPPLREQAAIQDKWTKERIDNVPAILNKYGVDAWLMSQKEYAEDTVFWSLKSAKQFSARRRTVNLFIANPTKGTPSSYSWIDNTPEVWSDILEVLESQNPSKIAINADESSAFSGGLHVGELGILQSQLGKWAKRFVVERMVAIEFVGTMVPGRLEWYEKLQHTAWAMISEGFSSKVIVPGVTRTEDVEWWLRDKIQQMNYTTWFHPDVSILGEKSPFEITESPVINYGDLLHVDFGVTAMGMNTDTQHMAYVLRPGETDSDIPVGYLEGLKQVNRLQDIVKGYMVPGATGNSVLEKSLNKMRAEGFDGRVYCHPIGDWGHAAGALIGMFNLQEGVSVLGEVPLLKQSYFSVELYAEHFVPERNLTMNFFLEEDVRWDEKTQQWVWVVGRQEKFHLIHPAK